MLEGCLGGSLENCREAVKVEITDFKDAGLFRILGHYTFSTEKMHVLFCFGFLPWI